MLPLQGQQFNAHYAYALAIDPQSGIIHDTNILEPNFLLKYLNMFKIGKKNIDSFGIMEIFIDEYRKDESAKFLSPLTLITTTPSV